MNNKGWVTTKQNNNGSFTITGRVGEYSAPLRTEPHNQFVVNNDRPSSEWVCTQSPSLSLDGSFETMHIWFKVIDMINRLMEGDVSSIDSAIYWVE